MRQRLLAGHGAGAVGGAAVGSKGGGAGGLGDGRAVAPSPSDRLRDHDGVGDGVCKVEMKLKRPPLRRALCNGSADIA